MDNCPDKTSGKELNDMVHSSKRACTFNPGYLAEAKRRIETAQAEVAARKAKAAEAGRRKQVRLANKPNLFSQALLDCGFVIW